MKKNSRKKINFFQNSKKVIAKFKKILRKKKILKNKKNFFSKSKKISRKIRKIIFRK